MVNWSARDLFRANSRALFEGDRLTVESTATELMRRTDTSPERCARGSREQAERRLEMHRSGRDRQYL